MPRVEGAATRCSRIAAAEQSAARWAAFDGARVSLRCARLWDLRGGDLAAGRVVFALLGEFRALAEDEGAGRRGRDAVCERSSSRESQVGENVGKQVDWASKAIRFRSAEGVWAPEPRERDSLT